MMIPCCFHPTRVVIVNDTYQTGSSLDENLPKSHMTFEFFNETNQALHYVNEVYKPKPFYVRYVDQNGKDTTSIKREPIDTHKEIYRPDRFEEISTVVLDCDSLSQSARSSKLSCLEFLQNVKDQHIQKIVLIDEEDQDLATYAIKEGMVQHIICKQDQNWEEQLNEILQEAQWQYFNKLSEIFISTVRPGVVKEYAIDDPHFQKFFKAIISTYGFTEAYLCEATGSYLFLDGQAQDHGLVVNIAEQLDGWVRAGQAKGINFDLLKALKKRKKMMCYHATDFGREPDKSHWGIYAHPAKSIQGQKATYYYAFAPNLYDIDIERVLPFKDYRENHQRKFDRVN
jgi:hypothetical protein